MKKGLIMILTIGIVTGGFIGCTSGLVDEMVIRENVRVERNEGNNFEVINLSIPDRMSFDEYANGSFYGSGLLNGTAEDRIRAAYVLDEHNNIKETEYFRNEIFHMYEGNEAYVKYYNLENDEVKILETFKDKSIDVQTDISSRMINDKLGFYAVGTVYDGDIYHKDNKAKKIEIIDLTTEEKFSCDTNLESLAINIFENNEKFYMLMENLELYELKIEKQKLKTKKVTDISEGFKFNKPHFQYSGDFDVYDDEIQLVLSDVEYEKGSEVYKNVIIKYNFKTGEKTFIELESGFRISALKRNKAIIGMHEEDKTKYFIAEIENNKVNIVSEFKYEVPEDFIFTNMRFIFNDEANEFVAMSFFRKEKGKNEDRKEYYKVNLENLDKQI